MTHLSREERKKIPVNCPLCGKEQKNVYSLAAHKGHCDGSRNTKHFKRGTYKGKTKLKIEDVLRKNSSSHSSYVKRFVVLNKLIENKCSSCDLPNQWQGKELVLELDHINGDSSDNRIENIRILCPNCHSQTSTFRGKNIRNKQKKNVSDEELLHALKNCTTISKALRSVGLSCGKNYDRCYHLLAKHKQPSLDP